MGSFDYVIVGAGSAGCALARRLSDEPGISVALLEAGGADDLPEIAAPGDYYKLWGSDIDWKYSSTPQAGTIDRVHQMPRGRVVGGTSSINGMVYLRGARDDYDGWAAGGCAGWDWAGVLPEFESMEQLLLPAEVDDHHALSQVFIDAGVEAGFPLNPSFDSGMLDGVGWNRATIRNGRRNNSYQAFLAPVRDRPKLTLMTGTLVSRLVFGSAGEVVGVEASVDGGAAETIHAGEVVLCAGAFESARLLLASGIGPAAQLAGAGIRTRADLPVGENLIDHLLVGVVYLSKQPISGEHPHITESCAFGRSSGSAVSDIEISFNKEEHFAPPSNDGKPRYTIIPGITRPKSRGTLRLQPGDPSAQPIIDPGYFTAPEDMRVMIEGIHMTRAIGETDAFRDWNGGESFPGREVESEAALKRYVSETVSTWFHPVGTCRMGVGADAVVDPSLRVHGVDGLRVADASIMPDIVSVNTNAASTMIGWKAGSIVLADSR